MTDKKTSTLYVIGDSFSVAPMPVSPGTAPVVTWPQMVANGLAEHLGHTVQLHNGSIMGSAQDYVWHYLQNLLEHQITDQDHVIITLTHPSRFWFYERLPELTNSNIIDLDSHVTRDEAKAIEHYIRYIQRLQLDMIHINNRMGYLCYQILKKRLHRPIVIKCFDQDVGQAATWPEINWAKGILMDDVQRLELVNVDADVNADFWHGLDCRYNHLCLTNHRILADKLIHSLITDTACDLTEGFAQGLIHDNAITDQQFALKEFDVGTVRHNLQHRDKFKPTIPWAQRLKLHTGQVDK